MALLLAARCVIAPTAFAGECPQTIGRGRNSRRGKYVSGYVFFRDPASSRDQPPSRPGRRSLVGGQHCETLAFPWSGRRVMSRRQTGPANSGEPSDADCVDKALDLIFVKRFEK